VRCTWVLVDPDLRYRCHARVEWPRRAPSLPATATASQLTRSRRTRSSTIGSRSSSSLDPGLNHRPKFPKSSTRLHPRTTRNRCCDLRYNRCCHTSESVSWPLSSTRTQCRSPHHSNRLQIRYSKVNWRAFRPVFDILVKRNL